MILFTLRGILPQLSSLEEKYGVSCKDGCIFKDTRPSPDSLPNGVKVSIGEITAKQIEAHFDLNGKLINVYDVYWSWDGSVGRIQLFPEPNYLSHV